jgi:hypothetical protein
MTLGSPENTSGVVVGAVYLDGKMLVDGNIQDTVVDTPVKNYAVLKTLYNNLAGVYNGNLVGQGSNVDAYSFLEATGPGASTGKYYWEITPLQGDNSSQSEPPIGVKEVGDSGTNYNTTYGSLDYRNNGSYGTVIGVAYDIDAKAFTFFLDGVETAASVSGSVGNGAIVPYFGFYGQLIPRTKANFGQQLFAAPNVTHNLAAGTVVIDGVTYSTFYEELAGYQVAGGYFYDEKNQKAVRGSDLRKRFGRSTANEQLGIYELTEVPGHQVIGYEKVGDKYQPLRDYKPEVRTAQAETAVAEAQADKYLNYLKSAATAWAVGRIFNEGDIIAFNGKLYRALNNMTSTADNDPADDTSDWEDLGINS